MWLLSKSHCTDARTPPGRAGDAFTNFVLRGSTRGAAVMSTQPSSLQPATLQRLGSFLQGVQHVGVTVTDMEKSLRFYVNILGGKIAIAGNGFYGGVLQN